MKALSMLLIFAGYVLVYAAVAKRGAYAYDPWAGLFSDAYTDLPQIPSTLQQSATGPTPTPPGFHTLKPPILTFPRTRNTLVPGSQSGLPAK